MTKSEIRKVRLTWRKTLESSFIESQSLQIVPKLIPHLETKNNAVVSIFVPISRFKELNTLLIRDELRQLIPSLRWVYPVVKGDTVIHLLPDEKDPFLPDAWGIPTPSSGIQIETAEIDVFIVPLLAWSPLLHRIGYGKGFYDRLLSEAKDSALKIGLSYSNCCFSFIPDSYDVKLDLVVSAD
jgi:5-formyltetrahydrofolate cyclo-ligase